MRMPALAVFSLFYLSFPAAQSNATALNLSDDHVATALWMMVAKADTIISGDLDIPEEDIRLSERNKKYQYLTIRAKPSQMLKGDGETNFIEIAFFTGDTSYTVGNDHLINRAQERVIAFLVFAEGKYYFSQTGDSALQAASDANLALVAVEVSEQERILSEWQPDTSIPHFETVRQLIRKARSGEQQAAAFRQLEALGTEAVPAIIAQMDDYTPLEERYIALKNESPDAFEDTRQYGPAVMVDALAAILNQLTGEDFGTIFNGATERERKTAIAGWRIYGMKHPAYSDARPSKSGGAPPTP